MIQILQNIKSCFSKKYIFTTLFLFFIFIMLYFIRHRVLEKFTNNKTQKNPNNPEPQKNPEWPQELKDRFSQYQSTASANNYKYDLEILQQQVSAEEVEEYLKTGYWNWDEDLKQMYLDRIQSNTIIKSIPEQQLNDAMKKYTSEAIKILLAFDYKEGKFLLYGGKSINGNVVKCSNNPEPMLEEIIDGEPTIIHDENIPNVMTGFTFIDNPCNPCVAINDPIHAKCAFKLNVLGNADISPIWAKIWGIN